MYSWLKTKLCNLFVLRKIFPFISQHIHIGSQELKPSVPPCTLQRPQALKLLICETFSSVRRAQEKLYLSIALFCTLYWSKSVPCNRGIISAKRTTLLFSATTISEIIEMPSVQVLLLKNLQLTLFLDPFHKNRTTVKIEQMIWVETEIAIDLLTKIYFLV